MFRASLELRGGLVGVGREGQGWGGGGEDWRPEGLQMWIVKAVQFDLDMFTGVGEDGDLMNWKYNDSNSPAGVLTKEIFFFFSF